MGYVHSRQGVHIFAEHVPLARDKDKLADIFMFLATGHFVHWHIAG